MNYTASDIRKAKEELWRVVPMGYGMYLNLLITHIERLEQAGYGDQNDFIVKSDSL